MLSPDQPRIAGSAATHPDYDRIEAAKAVPVFARGDRVTYVPGHAVTRLPVTASDVHHPAVESGTVSSVGDDGIVFVKFDATVKKLGWRGTTAMACMRINLVNHGGAKD